MSKLMTFLMENPIIAESQVVVSERLRDHPFTIRPMSMQEFGDYQKLAVQPGKKGAVEMNVRAFNEQVVLNHTLDPNFKDAAAIQKAGVATPEQLLGKLLLPGEIMNLARQITKASGFGQDMDDLVVEAKNS